MSNWEMVIRLIVAAGLGSVIGMERERLVWTAGLRTHMLVSVGACLMILVSAFGFSDAVGEHVVLDPSRVAAQVVSGIGFLGAGSIILRNEVVKGLTTAASLWAVAGIGLAAGAGLYVPAIATTVIIVGILVGLKPLEARYHASRPTIELRLRTARGTMSVGYLEGVLGRRAGKVKQIIVHPAEEPDRDDVVLMLDRIPAQEAAQIVSALEGSAAIFSVKDTST